LGCSPATYYLAPADTAPLGAAPKASHRLVASYADGTRDYALVLPDGDELASAVLAFAKSERVVAARFTAIGAVRDVHVVWFDLTRNQHRVSELSEQLELFSLVGDVGVDDESHAPIVLTRAPPLPSRPSVSMAPGTRAFGPQLNYLTAPRWPA